MSAEEPDFQDQARDLVATLAMKAAETLPTPKRIMAFHGIAQLFPKDSPEWKEAKDTAYALATAEKKQMRLRQLFASH